ncbi:MAG: hypothetical protein DRZ79_01415 [Candidatus Cloacimonadota bacterium]|nr:MAG: hypothetical protein DRZ79_01415 [Candidatus Cloacimonadota bacterium]
MEISLTDYLDEIDGKILTENVNPEKIFVNDGYVSDLLSDVMGNAKAGQVWITIMRHLNVIAVASLTNLSAIVFAKNMIPEPTVISKANEEGICLISSPLSAFVLAGKLYKKLNL